MRSGALNQENKIKSRGRGAPFRKKTRSGSHPGPKKTSRTRNKKHSSKKSVLGRPGKKALPLGRHQPLEGDRSGEGGLAGKFKKNSASGSHSSTGYQLTIRESLILYSKRTTRKSRVPFQKRKTTRKGDKGRPSEKQEFGRETYF